MSVLRPALNELPPLPPVVVAVVVPDEELDLFEDPHPADATASAATNATMASFFTGISKVLDSGTKTVPDSTLHAVVGVVLRVRAGRLEVQLASAELRNESLEAALGRALDLGSLTHVEQLETRTLDGGLATAYLGLVRPEVDLPGRWHEIGRLPELPPGTAELILAAQARLRAKLSYTNVGFALAPETFTLSELRQIYVAALGHDVSSTNLQRVLVRRRVLQRVDGRRAPGRSGGRPAALFRFASQRLEVTDEFAALRPPRF
jgi:ADP-ribose pyrophosphatase YjhB (NUDIX family)